MQTILVPTDGSPSANKAIDVAADLALQHGAGLRLLHVLLRDKEPHELLRLAPLTASGDGIVEKLEALAAAPAVERTAEELMADHNCPERPAPEDVLRDIGRLILGQAESRAADRGVEVQILEIGDGAPAEEIANAAKSANADTIVMGTRGLRQIEALAFGSVSQEVCRSVDCTCVAVH